VLRIPQYVAQADRGELDPAARPVVLKESGVTALLDGQGGFGHFSTGVALDWAMAHAREHGLAAAAVRHSGHIGRLGEYAERAAGQGLIGVVTVGQAGPDVGVMVLHGGRQRFLGANPWAVGVPAQGRPPMIFDGSTSTIAEGKVRLARAKGVPLPPGCIIDRDGAPSTNPEDFYAGGAIVPLGGAVAGHKGYGLAMASALIGGLAMVGDADPMWRGAVGEQDAAGTRERAATLAACSWR
jgi:LDH2 family malate/lactate/ureidoglycolate dehydrogenase